MAWSDSLAAQYEAATTGAGLVRLDGWTTIRVAGADRAKFLHNMCTADILNLPVGGHCEAFLTDVKGKIVAHVFVSADADALFLATVPGQAARVIAHLEHYVVVEKVTLTDVTSEWEWWVLVGRNVTDASGMAIQLLWPGGCLAASPLGRPPDGGDVLAVDGAVWHALRIESGWPLFGLDFDGSNLPQEVGRDAQAISFRKGCYLGQETIARIDALGHVNKRLATVRLEGEAPVGAKLLAGGQVVGTLSSVAWSPQLRAWLGLAIVRRGHNEPGEQLLCEDKPAEVVPTPAVAPRQ